MIPNAVTDPKVLEHLTDIVRANLIGDEIILRACHYETISRDNGYHEDAYVVAWQSETRLRAGYSVADCGTHRVHYNNRGESMLFSGHYDCTREVAFESLNQRMEDAPILVR